MNDPEIGGPSAMLAPVSTTHRPSGTLGHAFLLLFLLVGGGCSLYSLSDACGYLPDGSICVVPTGSSGSGSTGLTSSGSSSSGGASTTSGGSTSGAGTTGGSGTSGSSGGSSGTGTTGGLVNSGALVVGGQLVPPQSGGSFVNYGVVGASSFPAPNAKQMGGAFTNVGGFVP